eukprot:355299-Chlamydomonas_euryale.AAC.2
MADAFCASVGRPMRMADAFCASAAGTTSGCTTDRVHNKAGAQQTGQQSRTMYNSRVQQPCATAMCNSHVQQLAQQSITAICNGHKRVDNRTYGASSATAGEAYLGCPPGCGRRQGLRGAGTAAQKVGCHHHCMYEARRTHAPACRQAWGLSAKL